MRAKINNQLDDCLELLSKCKKNTKTIPLSSIKLPLKIEKMISNGQNLYIYDLVIIGKEELTKRLNNSYFKIRKLYKCLSKFSGSFLDSGDAGLASYMFEGFNLLRKVPENLLDKEVPYYKANSIRLINTCLKENNLRTYKDLLDMGPIKITEIKYFGRKSAMELNSIIVQEFKALTVNLDANNQNNSKTQYDIFINNLVCSFDNLKSITKENNKDYSLFQNMLITQIMSYAKKVLKDIHFDIFSMLETDYSNYTLLDISDKYNLSTKMIEQIYSKCKKDIIFDFTTEKSIDEIDEIQKFYYIFNLLEKDDIVFYILFSKEKNKLDFAIIDVILDSLNIDKNSIKSYSEKANNLEDIDEKKTFVSLLENYNLTTFEKVVYLSLLECKKYRNRTSLQAAYEYIVGDGTKPNGAKYHGYCKTTAKEAVALAIRKLIDNNLVYYAKSINGKFYVAFNEIISEKELEKDTDTLILECVLSRDHSFGKTMIIQILMGSNSEKMNKNNLKSSPYYAVLKGKEKKSDVEMKINALIDKGLLAKTNSIYPCLYVTDEGKNFLKQYNSQN